ncbi:MAG: AI-2E family transporter [Elusimicrobia bacterium]|nr:AI-2E family transporter [Elusimicrobiota bacterium]
MGKARDLPILPVLAVLGGGLYAAYHVRAALIPFLLSFALAYLFNPVVNFFEARGLRRDQTVLALYLLIAVGISVSANFVLPTITAELSLLQTQVPLYFRRAQEYLGGLQAELASRLPFGHTIIDHLSLRMYEPALHHAQKIPGYLLTLVPLLSLLFLVPFITFFMLMDSSRTIQHAIQVCPSRYVEQALHLLCEIDTSLGNYLRGVLIVAIAIAAASFVGLTAFGVDYALAIATLSGLVSFVPYAGAVLGAVVGALVALYQFKSAVAAGKVVALFMGIRLADEILLQPVVSKHSVHLHPLIYLLALMVGGQAFGFVGLLFAVPAACIVKVLIQLVWDWYLSGSAGTLPTPAEARIPYV